MFVPLPKKPGFNPLIGGADRATEVKIKDYMDTFGLGFNPLIGGADRATENALRECFPFRPGFNPLIGGADRATWSKDVEDTMLLVDVSIPS